MKKFSGPFDSYGMHKEKLAWVEFIKVVPPDVLAKIQDNPIYYYYALQYRAGSLYRAVLGYEEVWNREAETKLVRGLDIYLGQLQERTLYYFEDIVTNRRFYCKGLAWRRGVKPPLRFLLKNLSTIWYPEGTAITARINLEDAPNHVDLEFPDGRVMSVSYMNYLNWKSNGKLRKRNRKKGRFESHEDYAKSLESSTSGASPSQSFTGAFDGEPTWPLPDNVHDLRQTLKRKHEMQKTSTRT